MVESACESRKWNREIFTSQTTCFELFNFVILNTTLELHPRGKCNRSIPHLLIYQIFSCILFFKAPGINYFLDFVYAFKMGKYISIMRNTCRNFYSGWLFFFTYRIHLWKQFCILFCSWQELSLGLENTLALENYFLWRALMPDTVTHPRQPFRSKQQPNLHGHTDKLSERHVKKLPWSFYSMDL